jgi:hypothetical protein
MMKIFTLFHIQKIPAAALFQYVFLMRLPGVNP